jgi:hypothetical protein
LRRGTGDDLGRCELNAREVWDNEIDGEEGYPERE